MRALSLILMVVLANPVLAITVGSALDFDSPEKEALYRQLLMDLRCTVCQNQSLVDSNAPLARDLRRLTYQKVQEGADRESIHAFMVARYGDFVLYKPPLRSSTWLLWFGPLLFVLLGGLILWRVMVHYRNGAEASAVISPQARERLSELMREQGEAERR